MDLLYQLAGLVVAVVLLASACLYLFDPRRGGALLKRLAVGIVVFVLASTIARPLVETLRARPFVTLLILFLASVVAYGMVRSQRDYNRSSHRRERRERTPLLFRPRDDDF